MTKQHVQVQVQRTQAYVDDFGNEIAPTYLPVERFTAYVNAYGRFLIEGCVTGYGYSHTDPISPDDEGLRFFGLIV